MRRAHRATAARGSQRAGGHCVRGRHAAPKLPRGPSHGDFRTRSSRGSRGAARLDADYVWFNHPDYLFRRPSAGDALRAFFPFLRLPESALRQEVTRTCSNCAKPPSPRGGRLSFPLAVGFHPDHRLVCDVGRALHALGRHRVEFYEDVPYAHFPVMSIPAPALTRGARGDPILAEHEELSEALVLFLGLSPTPTFLQTLFYLPLLSALEFLSACAGPLLR